MMATQPQLSSQPPDFFPQVQPRSSSERDNSLLLHAALKAASTDMAHRLLDYASFDKVDCEASCILIALANHDDAYLSRLNTTKEETETKETITVKKKKQEKSMTKEPVTPLDHNKKSSKNHDPMMLLMAAAEVVNRQSSEEKRREYPNGRYYHRKSLDEVPISQHYLTKRIRPASPPPSSSSSSIIPEKKKYRNSDSSHHSNTMIKDPSIASTANTPTAPTAPTVTPPPPPTTTTTTTTTTSTNSFSRQYHSMKQNPKIKQNALHTYITYMIYNDLAHHGGMRKQTYNTSNQSLQPSHQQKRPNEYNRGFYHTNTDSPHPFNRPSTDANMITPSSTADNSSWFSSSSSPNIPQPPSQPNHDERSILSRPLTAFLWDASSNTKMTAKEEKKDMMILPPLASKRASNNNIYDRLPPL